MNLHTFHQIFTHIHQYSPIFTNIPYAPANLLAAQKFLVFKTQNSPVFVWLLPTRNNSQHSPCLSVIYPSYHFSLSESVTSRWQTPTDNIDWSLLTFCVWQKHIYTPFWAGEGGWWTIYITLLVDPIIMSRTRKGNILETHEIWWI